MLLHGRGLRNEFLKEPVLVQLMSPISVRQLAFFRSWTHCVLFWLPGWCMLHGQLQVVLHQQHGSFHLPDGLAAVSDWAGNALSTITPNNYKVPNALSLDITGLQRMEISSQFYNRFAPSMYSNTRPYSRPVPQYATSNWAANSFRSPKCLCTPAEWLQHCLAPPDLGKMATGLQRTEIIMFLSNSTWFLPVT